MIYSNMSSTVFGFRPKNSVRLCELTKAHFKGDGFVSQSKPSYPCNMMHKYLIDKITFLTQITVASTITIGTITEDISFGC